MQSTEKIAREQAWTTGAFYPEIGAIYEIDFGRIALQGRTVDASATVRIDGPNRSDWIDLNDGKPLSEELSAWSVKRFRIAKAK